MISNHMENKMEIRVEQQVQGRAIVKKFTTTQMKLGRQMAATMNSVKQYLDQKGIEPAGPPLVIYYNTDNKNLQVAIGYPVNTDVEADDGMENIETKKGKAVVGIHEGSYLMLGSTYKKMTKWMKNENLQPDYLAYESYLNSPEEVKTKELRTKVILYIR